MNKNIVIAVLVFISVFLASSFISYVSHQDEIKSSLKEELESHIFLIDEKNKQINEYKKNTDKLLETNKNLKEVLDEINEFFERFEIKEFEITNYAPLGSGAIEGMCFEGNPNITASGQQFVPYLSAAASREIPFGTKLYVEGFGYYEVHDRGGMITEGKLDLGVMETDEAYGFGRQKRLVLVERH